MGERNGSEFYVGYLPNAPAGLGGTMRWVAAGMVTLAMGIAVILVLSQHRFSEAAFEFGHPRVLTGTVVSDSAIPSLLVARPGVTSADRAVSRYLLSRPGKFGARGVVADYGGRAVTLEGTLAYRDGMTMLEIVPGTIRATGTAPAAQPTLVSHGTVTVGGEIVDGKCFLGVMKPGEGKPHRACAARCISGGVPPLMVVRDATGDYRYLLLVGPGGESVQQAVLPFVAEPVEITGQLMRSGDVWMLRADLATLRRGA